jgi:CheY-like chemotaxis protein
LPGKRVLVVDDDETFRLIARETLQRKGCVVSEAGDGAQALEAARHDPPDLIVMDIMMPGADGVSMCREVRETDGLRETPILVVTALNDSKVLRDALRFGADAHLVKPVDALVFWDSVQKLLAGRPPRPTL